MNIQNVQEDGKGENIEYREHVSEKDLQKSTPELMTLPTIELFYLLRITRKKRKEKYDELYKARCVSEDSTESKDVQVATADYQFYTKKMYIIENILNHRIGYIPERINHLFLENYLLKIKNSKKNKQNMTVY